MRNPRRDRRGFLGGWTFAILAVVALVGVFLVYGYFTPSPSQPSVVLYGVGNVKLAGPLAGGFNAGSYLNQSGAFVVPSCVDWVGSKFAPSAYGGNGMSDVGCSYAISGQIITQTSPVTVCLVETAPGFVVQNTTRALQTQPLPLQSFCNSVAGNGVATSNLGTLIAAQPLVTGGQYYLSFSTGYSGATVQVTQSIAIVNVGT